MYWVRNKTKKVCIEYEIKQKKIWQEGVDIDFWRWKEEKKVFIFVIHLFTWGVKDDVEIVGQRFTTLLSFVIVFPSRSLVFLIEYLLIVKVLLVIWWRSALAETEEYLEIFCCYDL